MSGKRKKSSQPRAGRKYLTDRILRYLKNNEGIAVDYRNVARAFDVRDAGTKLLIGETLQQMAKDGLLHNVSHGRYVLATQEDFVEGVISIDRRGNGLLKLSDGEELEVPARDTLHALEGDTVRATVSFNRKLRINQGTVVAIVKRARTRFVGLIQMQRSYAFLVPDNRKMPFDMYIPLEALNGAKHGDKAVGEITSWPHDADNPFGTIVDVLGRPGDNNTEMHAILAQYGLPYDYPRAVNEAANKLDATISPEERKKRRDFTELHTITIDPDTAKDFDDAISLRFLEGDRFEVGVHIADVTHYVTPDSIINAEALERATSVYLVDRTVPMLPERLCNDICSLKPDVERLTFSILFTLDAQAEVRDVWIGRGIIKSRARLTYEQAQEDIEGGDSPHAEVIRTLHGLAQHLRSRRFANGAIDFATEEVKFILDKNGKPLSVEPVEYNESHQLIEEFMLLANRTVAEKVGKQRPGESPRPFVYRVHDRPDSERLDQLFSTLVRIGVPYRGDTTKIGGKEITAILNRVRGAKTEQLVNIMAIRSMEKAVYTTRNIGHFGLAFDYYTHFTSPIRRYPDMMVHRLLTDYLAGKQNVTEGQLESECVHASEMEKRAADAERASIKYKQVEFMEGEVGKRFDGVVSGMKDFGLFVQLNESKCEGMVPMREFFDDYYVYNPDDLTLEGRRTGRIIRLGDAVTVEVLHADVANRFLDFLLIAHGGEKLRRSDRRKDSPSSKSNRGPSGRAKPKAQGGPQGGAKRGNAPTKRGKRR